MLDDTNKLVKMVREGQIRSLNQTEIFLFGCNVYMTFFMILSVKSLPLQSTNTHIVSLTACAKDMTKLQSTDSLRTLLMNPPKRSKYSCPAPRISILSVLIGRGATTTSLTAERIPASFIAMRFRLVVALLSSSFEKHISRFPTYWLGHKPV